MGHQPMTDHSSGRQNGRTVDDESTNNQSDGWDPLELPNSFTPAKIRRPNGVLDEIAADHQILKSGWIRVRTFDKAVIKFPPHAVDSVRRISTTLIGEPGGNQPRDQQITEPAILDQLQHEG